MTLPVTPPASFGNLLLEELTYVDSGGNEQTYGVQARVGVSPAAEEYVTYVSLFRRLNNQAKDQAVFISSMDWYASHPDPLSSEEFYVGFDYEYSAPPTGLHWVYHVQVFATKQIEQLSGDETLP